MERRSEKGKDDKDQSRLDDLTKLEEITLDRVLDCLINRFNLGCYYTFAGSVLISLNPCLKNVERVGIPWSGEENSPHVYSIGRRCKDNLRRVGSDQIVVVSGDSGAGKTTVTQQLLCYFIENSDVGLSSPITHDGLERRIYCATQILEAFGNASTVANPNSSRFGRLVQIIYGNQKGTTDWNILGARIDTCLLEKHRVSKCGPNERNFHIFYYILMASQHNFFNLENIVKNLALDGLEIGSKLESFIPEDFKQSLRSTDADGFKIFYDSIRTLNMVSEIYSVFEIMYGLMILSSLKFVAINSEEKENDPYINHSQNTFNSRYFRVDCDSICKKVIQSVFKIDFEALEDSLVARIFSAGRRKSSIRKPCETIKECNERLSAFVTTIYDKIFNHILHRLNSLLGCSNNLMNTSSSNMEKLDRGVKSVSLLDLYGFENLKANHLEQLCINYANERLQQVHISHLRNYIVESVDDDEKGLESLNIFNQVEMQTISRLDGLHRYVFSTLDETCVLNRPQTDAQVFSRMVEVFKGNSFMSGRLHDENYPFIVQHYASTVTYDLRGMVDKNRDYIPPEFLDLLRLSQNHVVASIFKVKTSNESNFNLKEGGNSHKIRREKTILQHFKASVESLVCRLETSKSNSQDVHFIRCIRPNDTLEYGKIQRKLVEQQLYSCGIVDVIRITGNGYPVRLPVQKFVRKFHPLIRRCFNSCFNRGDEARLNLDTCDFKFGKTQIFLTESTWEFLNILNAFVVKRSTKILQQFWRNELAKRALAREELLVLQELCSVNLLQDLVSNDNTMEHSFGSDHGTAHNLSLTKIETTLLNSLPCKITMRRKKKPVQRNAIYTHVPRSALSEFNSMVHTNKRKDIVSKRFVYESPVRFYVKKTTLSHNHLLPRRFLPKGIMDAFDDSNIM
ncbi:unnamed protein product [Allacma fusca]|uniref:Myosin motor domain-containing protein n=1 Tax=Allacma fusca TaxID=39272 RepID=A0A8J2K8W6_9HEXA|nr:unnamed protein product [Allacma fusca]